MSLANRPMESVEESDLQALIENEVAESRTIEYKQSLPGNSRDDRKEFLADVSSFANASGGHLIYGMREQDGVAAELLGLQIDNVDSAILRLENIIRDGVQPRIPGVSTRAISLEASGVALIIHIPRSWVLPHRVTLDGHGHFYSRNSAGKYRLDVSELRAAFGMTETAAERIRNFRVERLSMIVAGETPAPMDEGAKVALHIIPASASDPSIRFDVSALASDVSQVKLLYVKSGSNRHNLDGFLTYAQNSALGSYVQIFRDGTVEAVDRNMLRERDGDRYIQSVPFERELIEGLIRLLSIQNKSELSHHSSLCSACLAYLAIL